MSIDIPSEVVLFLNLLGLPYPDIDADQVRELGRYVDEFAADVQDTHEAATGAVKDMGSAYSGYSYEALLTAWGRMSAGNMAQLDSACELVSTALDVAATVIETVQAVVLAELAALAGIYLGMLLTPGGIVTSQLVAAGARRLLSGLQQMLMWYFAAEVIGKAIEPFEDTIEQIVSGALYDGVSDLLDVPPDAGQTLYIEPEEVRRYAGVIETHADTMLTHADKFAERSALLNFETPGLDLTIADGPIEPVGPVDPIVAPPRFGLQGLEHLLPQSANVADLSSEPQLRPAEPTRAENPPQADSPAAAQNGDQGIRPPGAADSNNAPPGPLGPPGPAGAATAAPSVTPDSTAPGTPASAAGSPGSSVPAADPAGTGHTPADSRPAVTGSDVSPAAESAAGMRGTGEGMGPVAGAPGQAPMAGQTPAGQRSADPAAKAPGGAGRTSGGAGRTSGGAGRTPARAGTEQQPPSARRENLRTPWSRRGKTVDRPAPAVPPKPATVSVGDNGDRPPGAGTQRPGDERAREANSQVTAPETTAPEPEAADGKPSDASRAADRDQQRDLPAAPAPNPDRSAGRA